MTKYLVAISVKHAVSVAMTLLLFLSVGCGSGNPDAEREEHQARAFDVSGRYLEDSPNGVPSILTISNEQPFHDIQAEIDLRGGFKEVDRQILHNELRRDDPQLSDAQVAALVGQIEASAVNIHLGEGETFALRGGENIARDQTGDIGELAFRRTLPQIASSEIDTYSLTVDLFLTAHRQSSLLNDDITGFTDETSRGTKGNKGLLLSISRGATGVIIQEIKLSIGAFIKY